MKQEIIVKQIVPYQSPSINVDDCGSQSGYSKGNWFTRLSLCGLSGSDYPPRFTVISPGPGDFLGFQKAGRLIYGD